MQVTGEACACAVEQKGARHALPGSRDEGGQFRLWDRPSRELWILRDNQDCSEREQGRNGARPHKASARLGLGSYKWVFQKNQNSQGNLTTDEWKDCFNAMSPVHTFPS